MHALIVNKAVALQLLINMFQTTPHHVIPQHGAFHLVRTHLGGRGFQVSYTFPLRITCEKKEGGGGGGVQIACKMCLYFMGGPHLKGKKILFEANNTPPPPHHLPPPPRYAVAKSATFSDACACNLVSYGSDSYTPKQHQQTT